jgi:hypothetical protein
VVCTEVEGIRTDIRIINMSLLGVDWYINHLRHATNDAGLVDLIITQDKLMATSEMPFGIILPADSRTANST